MTNIEIPPSVVIQNPADIETSSKSNLNSIWNGWKKLLEKSSKSEGPEKSKPLKIKFDLMRNGTLFLRFNQEIMVPDSRNLTKTRRLEALQRLNVTRDLLDLEIELHHPDKELIQNFSFTTELIDWQPEFIQLQLNFSDP